MPRALVLLALLVVSAAPGGAAVCQQRKLDATGKRTSSSLKCSATAVKKGLAVDPECLTKATDAFTAGFTKAERTACPTTGDAGAVGAVVDACVSAVLTSMGASSPPAPPAACLQAKIKAAGKRAQSDFKCQAKASVTAAVADPVCIDRSHVKFDAAVVKAETKAGCAQLGDGPQIAAALDTCVGNVLAVLPATTSTTTTTNTSTTTIPGQLDFTALGWFTPAPATFHPGLPSASFVTKPAGLTYAELEQLQQDCVDRINLYRSGTLTFSDSSSDPGVPKPALQHLMGGDRCSSAQALGDLVVNNGAGGCVGMNSNSFSCPSQGIVAQNTCCARSGSTYAAIRGQLFSCLQGMWDEGIGLPDNAAYTTADGHWWNMRNATSAWVSCGFAFDAAGTVWMNQDFASGRLASVPATCSCAGENVGDGDGCGGTCVAP